MSILLTENNQKLVDGYIRKEQQNTPPEIAGIIFLYFHILCEILEFDPDFKAEGVELSDDKKCAKKKIGQQIYILAGGDPVTQGEHLWRLNVCDTLDIAQTVFQQIFLLAK